MPNKITTKRWKNIWNEVTMCFIKIDLQYKAKFIQLVRISINWDVKQKKIRQIILTQGNLSLAATVKVTNKNAFPSLIISQKG